MWKVLFILIAFFAGIPAASAQFGFPPVNPIRFQIGGTYQSPLYRVNFNAGFSSSFTNGTLLLEVDGSPFVPTSRTITTLSPLGCAISGFAITAGASCSLGADMDIDLVTSVAEAWTAAHTWSINGIAATSTVGMTAQNSTAATAGVPVQQSPGFDWSAKVWDTDDAVSRTVQAQIELRPLSGTAPSASLVFLTGAADASPSVARLSISSLGTISTAANLQPGANKTYQLGTGIATWKRFFVGGTTTTADACVPSAGWGSTATCAVAGSDTQGTAEITTAGINLASNPTIAYTYKDGSWGTVPWCDVSLQATSDATVTAPWVTYTTTATVLTITFHALPVVTNTYRIQWTCNGGP